MTRAHALPQIRSPWPTSPTHGFTFPGRMLTALRSRAMVNMRGAPVNIRAAEECDLTSSRCLRADTVRTAQASVLNGVLLLAH